MYRIKLTPRNEGSKRNRKTLYSSEVYPDFDAARRAIIHSMDLQEKAAWQNIGLVDVSRTEEGNRFTLTIKPALRLYKGLTITYDIIKC